MGLLSRGPQHGYDLKRHHDELLPAARPMAFGQVYAALGRLAGKGLVAEAAVEQGSGPERVVYELTDAGRTDPSAPRSSRHDDRRRDGQLRCHRGRRRGLRRVRGRRVHGAR